MILGKNKTKENIFNKKGKMSRMALNRLWRISRIYILHVGKFHIIILMRDIFTQFLAF
jgi:hypothetical protein